MMMKGRFDTIEFEIKYEIKIVQGVYKYTLFVNGEEVCKCETLKDIFAVIDNLFSK